MKARGKRRGVDMGGCCTQVSRSGGGRGGGSRSGGRRGCWRGSAHRGKLVKWVAVVGRRLDELEEAALVGLQVALELGVHRLHLPPGRVLAQKRLRKKGGKPVECRFQLVGINTEMVACGLHPGEGIGRAAMPRNEILEGTLVRVLARPEEHHVLREVSETGKAFRVVKMAGGDLERRRSLLSGRVGDEECAQARGQLDVPVGPPVERGRLNCVDHAQRRLRERGREERTEQ
eukprot:scaffold98698_cov29-Tisochrysis_lutea.AAC.6